MLLSWASLNRGTHQLYLLFCVLIPGDDIEEEETPREEVVHFVDGSKVEVRGRPPVVVVYIQNGYRVQVAGRLQCVTR